MEISHPFRMLNQGNQFIQVRIEPTQYISPYYSSPCYTLHLNQTKLLACPGFIHLPVFSLHMMPISHVHKSSLYASFPKLTSFFHHSPIILILHRIQHYPHKPRIAMYLSHGSYHFVTCIHCVHVLHSFLGRMLFVVLSLGPSSI